MRHSTVIYGEINIFRLFCNVLRVKGQATESLPNYTSQMPSIMHYAIYKRCYHYYYENRTESTQ